MTLTDSRNAYGTFGGRMNATIQIRATGYYRVFVSVWTRCNWDTGAVAFVTKKNGYNLIEA